MKTFILGQKLKKKNLRKKFDSSASPKSFSVANHRYLATLETF